MRGIIFSKEFDIAVESVGGYRLVDEALDTVIDGLLLNPYGYSKYENDYVSFRYVKTKPFGHVPPLVFFFIILTNKDVELTDVAIDEAY